MKRILAVTLTIAMLAMLLFPASLAGAENASPSLYEQVLEEDGFIYGVNLPWITPADEGCTWASNTVLEKASAFDAQALEAVLRDIRAVGFNGVRISLFDQMQGLAFDEGGRLTGVSKEMLDNLAVLLELSDGIGIQLALVLSPDVGALAGRVDREQYDALSQVLTDSAIRTVYLEKVLKPVGELLAVYPDVVLAVDVLADPDGCLYDKTTEYGTNWSVLRDFIAAAAEQVRDVLPGVPVMASSAAQGQASVKAGKLDGLGLDILGVTEYNDTGSATPAKDLHVSTPLWLTEMGTLDPAVSEDVHTATTARFYQTAREGGYRAAFYGRYGDKSVTDGVTLIDATGRLRLAALALHFTILDNAYERSGREEYDRPALMNISSASSLRWIGSRYAASYTIERSTDGKTWSTVAANVDVAAVDPAFNNLCSYSDSAAQVNNFYYYRVTAHMDDGTEVPSDVSPAVYVPQMVCADEDNLLSFDTGFESGELGSEWYYNESDADFWKSGLHQGSVEDGTTHSGSWSYKLAATSAWNQMSVDVPEGALTPGTQYTFTMYYKVEEKFKDSGTPWIGLMKVRPDPYCLLHPQTDAENEYMVMNADGEWHAYTYTFTATDATYLFIVRNAHYGEIYIDDIYLFEAPVVPTAPTALSAAANSSRRLSDGSTSDDEESNLFEDGGFETGHVSNGQYEAAATHTDEQNIVSAEQEPENVRSGRYALTYTSTGNWSDRMLYRVDDLKPDTYYTYSYWYKITDYTLVGLEAGPTFGMAQANSMWDTFYSMPNWNSTADNWGWPAYETDGEWHQAHGIFYTGESTKFVFALWDDGNTWTAYIDDLYLAESAEAAVPAPDDFVVTAAVTQFVTDRLDVTSPDKNLLSEEQRTAALTAEQPSWSLEIAVEPDTDYILSAWVKGGVFSDTETGSARFGVANPYNGKFLMTAPVYEGDKMVAASFLSAMAPPCWDGEWHQRGLVFNSGNLESVLLTMNGTNSLLELRDIVLCKAEAAAAAEEESAPAAITGVKETPERMFGCKDEDNLFAGADLSEGAGYGMAARLASVDGTLVLRQDGSGLGATYILWVDVQPDTDYTFSVYAKGLAEGSNVFGLLTDQITHRQTVGGELAPVYDQQWGVYTYRFNSGGHTRVAFYAYDGGAELLLKNLALFESSKAVEVTEPINPPIDNPDTGAAAPAAAGLAMTAAVAALASTGRRCRRTR